MLPSCMFGILHTVTQIPNDKAEPVGIAMPDVKFPIESHTQH